MERTNLNKKIPVTILTGFLGSGKTTLLNRILRENHGKKIAVIENEFGEVGVDQELVVHENEEVIEMNNGCICCTVRGDLIKILEKFVKENQKFDYLLIETTGLANPTPVAQTFLTQENIIENYALDSIVTLVDAKHIWHHIDKDAEAKQQIAFADVIILNKIDLISNKELNKLKAKIKSINAVAKIMTSINAEVPISNILNINSFDIKQKITVDEKFLEIEYPFEFLGIYDFENDNYKILYDKGPDPSMKIFALEIGSKEVNSELINNTAIRFSGIINKFKGSSNKIIEPDKLYELDMAEKECLLKTKKGRYLIATQHHPTEFNLRIVDSKNKNLVAEYHKEFKPNHTHDNEVSSVGIKIEGDLNLEKLRDFFSYILQVLGPDIYRMKGIISIENLPNRMVFQGVHMLLTSSIDREWREGEKRVSIFIFIGKNLDRNLLTQGFLKCRTQ
ncbi:GTP-binding protein [Candidatus Pacearchaeota archaeon]|nr:GTP-binding protein [Candidatus Pacearchaeota archaeon]